MQKMKATVFHGPNDIRVEEVPRPSVGVGEAVIRITLTSHLRNRSSHSARRICGETGPGNWTRTRWRHRRAG